MFTASLSTFFIHFSSEGRKCDFLFATMDMHRVIFLAKKYKTEYRTSTNRRESVEMCDMHRVIFLAKKYKPEYRTSTNRIESVELSLRQLTPVFDKPAFSRFSQLFQPRLVIHSFGKIVKRPVCQNGRELPKAGRDVRYASCDFSGQEIQTRISHIDQRNRTRCAICIL